MYISNYSFKKLFINSFVIYRPPTTTRRHESVLQERPMKTERSLEWKRTLKINTRDWVVNTWLRMTRRRKKSDNRALEDDSYQQEQYEEFVKKLEKTEESFRNLLNPAESYVMGIQSVMVWENPKYSAVVFAVVNILFWWASLFTLFISPKDKPRSSLNVICM